MAVDPELVEGARNAVRVCLRIQPRGKGHADHRPRPASRSPPHWPPSSSELGAPYRAWTLEDVAPRPLVDMPRAVLDDLETSQVSIFAAQAQPNELRSRMQMTEVVNRRQIRHAHMVNIDRQIMLEGMRADFGEVDRISLQVLEIAQRRRARPRHHARRHRPHRRHEPRLQVAQDQRHHQPAQVGQPAGRRNLHHARRGERHVRGRRRGGRLPVRQVRRPAREPLTIRIKGNRLREAHCANRELEDEFWRYTHTDENSDRVGEFAIGTNIGVHDVIGNILQDEKIPGVHIAFGNPYGGTPARSGTPPPTSTWWAASSISGPTTA